ncbi:DUF4873 domain-containing protein [Prauserella cavernicola]|uniref:DUF4873 domain-containing protein n=1 Tax=Prauserella cavernicola TaxID=2800127 RepID=A0A934QYL6_9PSEU|nr:DUF4873 domain-containing protein [Prauserella cavernicola]MBK1788943.1 DUF4873 domain-containing protein [Prauserella cavernicola]
MSEHDDDHEDGYRGPATLVVGDTELAVEVQLRGHFQPIDGYYHWYGRVKADERLSSLAGGKKHKVEIRTPQGSARGEISDPDPWDRYRVMGTSTPPFSVPTSLEAIGG